MKILAIVITYNGLRWIERCLESLRASRMPVDAVIIDNGSSDGTPEQVRSLFPEMELIINKENTGFGAANNIGLRLALERGYDFAYLLNQDAWIMPDTIEKLVAACSSRPEFGLVSPMQMKNGGKEMDAQFLKRTWNKCQERTSCECQHADNELKNNDSDVPQARAVSGDVPKALSVSGDEQQVQTVHDHVPQVLSVRYVMAAHWLISRECLEKTGIFAPLFPIYGEDENYCARAIYHGFKIGIVPSAIAVHDRAERKEAKERVIFRNFYMKSLQMIANPLRKIPATALLYIIPYAFYCCFKYSSTLPLGHLKKVLLSCPKAVSTLKESKKTGAFI